MKVTAATLKQEIRAKNKAIATLDARLLKMSAAAGTLVVHLKKEIHDKILPLPS